MNALQRHNAHAMRAGQAAWDNATPPEDDGREDYITEQAECLLKGWDADQISFLPYVGMTDFASRADEVLADQDCDCQIVQIVVALLTRDTDKAIQLADQFHPALAALAEEMVTTQLEHRA